VQHHHPSKTAKAPIAATGRGQDRPLGPHGQVAYMIPALPLEIIHKEANDE
jgi:hypothetical protein